MKVKIMLAAVAVLTLFSPAAVAQVKDSVHTNIREYNDELGFYQRANRDQGDPRFMFYDETAGLSFGVGGTAKVASYYGFVGSTSISDGSSFNSSSVTVPTDFAPAYGTSISASEIHAKARANWQGHKMIAFVKIGGKEDGTAKFKQAYISLDGFSFGLIPSFFMDMEAGVMTTGMAPDSQIDRANSLIGYTHRFGNNLSLAVAAEKAVLDLSHYDYEIDGVSTDFQPIPDFTSRLKYRWDNGHVQFGALVRDLTYWAVPEEVIYFNQGENRHCWGYGLSFSGNYKPVKPLKLSWQFVGGRGISAYLSDLSGIKADVGLCGYSENGLRLMGTVPVASGMVAAQYDWGSKFSSSAIVSHSRCFEAEGVHNYDILMSTWTATANFFWNLSDYAYFGVEYLYGYRRNIPLFGVAGHFGQAQRVGAVLAFLF